MLISLSYLVCLKLRHTEHSFIEAVKYTKRTHIHYKIDTAEDE